ncbi:acyl-coenzyme A thioesterase 9, mitochondrial isoform X2 [Eurytemora carolleeae]|uniref:acyl-coenzyme A thioesterase 9, mitochondrial isoform X2 n=1 Tax=Eurytemora carolleeae TaxID=1294199 RepID=UPI000C78B3EE|nr:acyl-coenzyme A thioesterase 9, mitochondrial isoform X2 [Eurytemora carolleeae]|eukprot:XP_023335369.1 acyl-coenzyme A thioesterase 9, mitochondrial-like isoform X2 [Eurytemora affinis]
MRVQVLSRRLLGRVDVMVGLKRGIIVPPNFKVERTIEQVVSILSQDVIGGPKNYDPELYNKMREELIHVLPETQEELPKRRMMDSYDAAIIPLGSNPVLRDRQKPGSASPFSIVTALVDKIDFKGKIHSDSDIRMSGHVTWVGKSSAESTLYLEQKRDGEWTKVTEARFVLVARDPLNRGSAFINPLEAVTEEEKVLFNKGEENKIRRFQMSQDSLFRVPPTVAEMEIIHDIFIRTVDHKAMSFKARVKPVNTVWMEDAKLKNLIICQLEYRNRFNKIFGGFIMRQAFELAWANTHVYGHCRPYIVHVDDIWFRKPVEVGSMLYFNSQICYTSEQFVQTRVSAEVWDPKSGEMSVTNVFQFTFELRDQNPAQIIPKTYHEAMMYLTGRRHFVHSIAE